MDLAPRSPHIFEALATKRQILLQGEVDVDIQEKILRILLYLNTIDTTPITLFIDTLGGSTESSLYICDAIRYSPAKVKGLVVADAHSAGFRILQACDRRLAYPHAELAFHAPAPTLKRIDAHDWKRNIVFSQKEHKEQLSVYAKRSGQPINRCRQWAKEEKRFTAAEALKFGFIDEIMRPPKK